MTFIYRKEIDGLRALAVMQVILFHLDFEIFQNESILMISEKIEKNEGVQIKDSSLMEEKNKEIDQIKLDLLEKQDHYQKLK